MAHTHAEDRTSFYLEQLCAIGFCGLLGGVAIMLYQQNLLRFILIPQLHIFVLVSGVAIVALIAIRGLFLWQSTGRIQENHTHEHEEEHECCADHEHDHHHHDHDRGHAHHHHHAGDSDLGHESGDDCGLGHLHGDDDHGHDHGWRPWRYGVLLFPIVLYFILPDGGLSISAAGMNTGDLSSGMAGKLVENTGMRLSKATSSAPLQITAVTHKSAAQEAGLQVDDVVTQIALGPNNDGNELEKPEMVAAKDLSLDEAVAKLRGPPGTQVTITVERENGESVTVKITRKPDVINLNFKELEQAAYMAEGRSFYANKTISIKGQFMPGVNDKTFSLVRIKIQCCAADAIPLNVVIMLDPNLPANVRHLKPQQWVQVTGEIQFRKRKDRDEYKTVLMVSSPNDIRETDPDMNPYIQ